MPLKLGAIDGSYLWPVTISVPVDGRYDEFRFRARFKRYTQQETEALVMRAVRTAQALQLGQEPPAGGTDLDIAREIVEGWADVQGDDGADVSFSSAAFEQVLRIQGAANAIVTAWNDSTTGKRAKN